MKAQTLDQLYPAGTPLSEVRPDFRGMPLKLWNSLKITEQANELQAGLTQADRDAAPLNGQRIWTKRDDYGRKSL